MVKKILNEGPMKKTPAAIKWGKSNEMNESKNIPNSRKSIIRQSMYALFNCGFVVNGMFPWLGASPDFLIHDKHGVSNPFCLGEDKCPYSKRDRLTIDESCKDPQFCLANVNGKISLKQKHAFILTKFKRPWPH